MSLDDFARGYAEQLDAELLKTDRGLASTPIIDHGYLLTRTLTNMNDWSYRLAFESLLLRLNSVLETPGVLSHALLIEARELGAQVHRLQPDAGGRRWPDSGFSCARGTHPGETPRHKGRQRLPYPPHRDRTQPNHVLTDRFKWINKPPWQAHLGVYYQAGPWCAYDPLTGTLHDPVHPSEKHSPNIAFV
jgi:hypothetical protein